MKETIEAWAVVKHGNLDWVFNTEEKAKEQNKLSNGTVVKLTSEMPRELRKVSTEVWIKPDVVDPASNNLWDVLGIAKFASDKDRDCCVRARITMQELPDEV